MSSKFDRLRSGEIVEIEPGRKGRLNAKDKTFETSDGRRIYVGDDEDFFPSSEKSLLLSREKENLERDIARVPGGEFIHQFGQKGVIGGAKDWTSRLLRSGENYVRNKQANEEVSQKISKRSPLTSAAATAASFVPDIALTRGMSAFKAAPLISGLSAGSRVLEEPGKVAGEVALATGGGLLLDKATNFISRVSQRRGASRALPGQQAATAEQNALGRQKVENANLQQTQKYNLLQERTKNENAALLHQHNLSLNDRQNKMIEAQNAFTQAKANRESEIFRLKKEYEASKAQRSTETSRLKNEYEATKSAAQQEEARLNSEFKLAQTQYEEAVKNAPKLQKEAQAEYSKNVVNTSKEIENLFPEGSRISVSQLDPETFIEQSIKTSGLAASREGSQATRIIKSLFPEGETLSARELSKRYKAIEDAIQRASPEVQQVLTQFKNHLGERLPNILEDTIAHTEIMPLLTKDLENDIHSIFSKTKGISAEAKKNIYATTKTILSEIESADFINRLQNGGITDELVNRISRIENFLPGVRPSDAKELLKGKNKSAYKQVVENLSSRAEQARQQFISELQQKINNKVAAYEIKIMHSTSQASQKIGKNVKETYGMAERVPSPVAPQTPSPVNFPTAPQELPTVATPNIPGPISPPLKPSQAPQKPVPISGPAQPITQTFTPQPSPTLAPPQGIAEHAGDLLEKNLLGGKGLINNPFTKLAGLKYLFGKAALPAEAAYLGMKGLTSPAAAGEVARMSFKQGGIQAIEQLAQKYPSYHDGIIDNPQERRSLTKEIEDDPEIPIEEKALIQSKINRGKALQNPIS